MIQHSKRLKALFDEALELDAEARVQWVDRMRVTDPAIAARIERMLCLDAKRADPFGNAIDALKQTMDVDVNKWVNREIGDFRLVRLLGQGGMGAVFLAERQTRGFQQLVALKILHWRSFERTTIERFAEERRILARLHHPNIALFIDAGATDDGRPFMVMEYIEGVPLFEYCDHKHLKLNARLSLMRGLLAALAHAHRALVVHRDLKPGNVMVTSDGTPKLLDFGIARLIDPDAAPGGNTTRIFTPEYASPEQLAGEPVGTGSDIYSLGLVLYELCAGVMPWERGSRPLSGTAPPPEPSQRLRHLDSAHLAQIAAHRGALPQQLARELHGDLRRILARCLDPDPARRYTAVHELDVDLVALLGRRPPPGVQVPRHERMIGFARRHAWPLALALLMFLAGAGMLAQAMRGQSRLAAQRDRATAAADNARVEAAKSAQIASFVQSMLAGIDPDRANGMDRSLMRLVLDSAAKRADRELKGQPEVRIAIERTIAASYNAIAEYELAVQHFDTAIQVAKQSGNVSSRIALTVRKARSLSNLGRIKQSLAIAQKTVLAAAALPAESRTRLFAESTLAGLTCDVGNFQSCRDRFSRVLAVQRHALGDSDKDTEESMLGLAQANTALANYDDAQAMYSMLIQRYRARYGSADSHTLYAINGLAINYLEAKRYADAEKLLKPAVDLARETYGRNHQITLNMYSNLGGAIRQQSGRNAEARPYYEHSLAVMRERYGADSRRTVFAEMNLALLLRDSGELDDANRHARIAIAHMNRALGKSSPYCGILLTNLSSILILRHNYPEAEQALDRAWKLLDDAAGYGPAHPAVQDTIDRYVELYAASGQPRRAAAWRARQNTPDSKRGQQP